MDISRHAHLIGKTGSGKSSLTEYLAIHNQPFLFIDPHGQSASRLLSCVKEAVYFQIEDEWVFQFNPLSGYEPILHPKLAASIVDAFHSLNKNSWGPQLETILLCSLRAILYTNSPSLLSVYLMITSDAFRRATIPLITDRVIKSFWTSQFEQWEERLKAERTWSTMNKILQLIADPTIRNILVGANRLDLSVNTIVNLSGLAEHHQRLLGSLILNHALVKPKPCTVILDEAQYFSHEIIAHMIATVRKWGVQLVISHQFLSQFSDEVQSALLNSVGVTVLFQISSQDAQKFIEGTYLTQRDIATIQPFHAYIIAAGEIDYQPMPLVQTRYKGRTKRIHTTHRNYCRRKSIVESEVERILSSAYDGTPRSQSSGRAKRKKYRA